MRQKTAVHTLRLKAFFCSALRIDAFSFLLIYFKRYEIEKGYERRAHHHKATTTKKFKRNTTLKNITKRAEKQMRRAKRNFKYKSRTF